MARSNIKQRVDDAFHNLDIAIGLVREQAKPDGVIPDYAAMRINDLENHVQSLKLAAILALHEQGLTHQQIADKLQISRTRVTGLLIEARKQ